MGNRKKIMRFCKIHQIEVLSLNFERSRDYAYGDSWDNSSWELECLINGKKCNYVSGLGDSVNESVDLMLQEILEDLPY